MAARAALVRVDGTTQTLQEGDTLIGVALLCEIKLWSLPVAPGGWALCDGTTYLIADYPQAGALLGTLYGGDGVITFGVPDLRDRAPRGAGGALELGDTGGTDTVTLATANLPAHSHSLGAGASATTTIQLASDQTSNAADLTPTSTNHFIGGLTGGPGSATIWKPSVGSAPITQGGVTTTVSGSTESAGSGSAVTVTNPYLGLNFIIALGV